MEQKVNSSSSINTTKTSHKKNVTEFNDNIQKPNIIKKWILKFQVQFTIFFSLHKIENLLSHINQQCRISNFTNNFTTLFLSCSCPAPLLKLNFCFKLCTVSISFVSAGIKERLLRFNLLFQHWRWSKSTFEEKLELQMWI